MTSSLSSWLLNFESAAQETRFRRWDQILQMGCVYLVERGLEEAASGVGFNASIGVSKDRTPFFLLSRLFRTWSRMTSLGSLPF